LITALACGADHERHRYPRFHLELPRLLRVGCYAGCSVNSPATDADLHLADLALAFTAGVCSALVGVMVVFMFYLHGAC
jgi:hypothetical protein